MEILKVKEIDGGYLVNGNTFVPHNETHLEYREIVDYIKNGGAVEPILNDSELKALQTLEAEQFLQKTDWVEPYLIKHYAGITILPSTSSKFTIETKRKEAILLIQNNKG